MAEILVVDDEMGIRELLSEILGDEGHSVTLAENAQRAREAMLAHKVDLVNALELEKAAGKAGRIALGLLRMDLGPVHSSRFVFTSWNLDVAHGSANVE